MADTLDDPPYVLKTPWSSCFPESGNEIMKVALRVLLTISSTINCLAGGFSRSHLLVVTSKLPDQQSIFRKRENVPRVDDLSNLYRR